MEKRVEIFIKNPLNFEMKSMEREGREEKPSFFLSFLL
jgi:hypothetical protein